MSSATTIFACMKSCTCPAPTRRRLAGEAGLEEAAQRRHLPARVPVQPPLLEDAVDLRVVDDAGDVHLPVRADLGERAEDRAGAEHGRRDPHAPLRLADPLRDPVRQCLAVLGREPRPHLERADVDRPRLDVTGADHVTRLPELVEVEPVCVRELAERRSRRVLLARPRVLRPVQRAVQTVSRSRTTYLWCIRSGTPGSAGSGSERLEQLGRGRGGGGTGTGPGWSTL